MECYRFFYHKKILLLFAALFLLNGALFLREQLSGSSYIEIREETDFRLKLSEALSVRSDTERTEYLAAAEAYADSESRRNALMEIAAQAEYLRGYEDYVQGILAGAERISGFSVFDSESSGFSKQNAENTVRAYKRVEGVSVVPGNDKPLVQLIGYRYLFVFPLVMVILTAFVMARGQKNGMPQVIYSSAGGRFKLGVKRCICLCASSFLLHALCLLQLCLLSVRLYGEIDFGRSIQSIELFSDVTYCISTAGFVFHFYLITSFAIAIIGVFVWMCISLIPHTAVAALAVSAFLLAEQSFAGSLTLQHSLRYLKYMNVLEYLRTDEYLFHYYGFGIFGGAVGLLTVIKAGMIAFFLLFSISGTAAFLSRPSGGGRIKAFFQSVSHFIGPYVKSVDICKAVDKPKRYVGKCCRLFPMELYKTLVCNKGVWVLLFLAFAASGIVTERTRVFTETEQYIHDFYEKYAGTVTEEMREYLLSERETAEFLVREYKRIYELYREGKTEKAEYYKAEAAAREAGIALQGLDFIDSEVRRADALKEARGIQICLFDTAGYQRLFTEAGANTQRKIAVFALLSQMVLLSGSFQYEETSQMVRLLRSAPNGRTGLFRAKRKCAVVLSVFVTVLFYAIHIYAAAEQYGLPELSAPVQSVKTLQDFPLPVSLFVYLTGINAARIIVYALAGVCLFQLSAVLEQKALLIGATMIVIVPVLLERTGHAVWEKLSLFELFNVNGIVTGRAEPAWTFGKLAVLLAVLIGTGALSRKNWRG